jgi:hypothetical protein
MKTFVFRICEGTKDPAVVLAEQVAKYKEVFQLAWRQVSLETHLTMLIARVFILKGRISEDC